jgi:general L-amino acid transport system substrate-binding protein
MIRFLLLTLLILPPTLAWAGILDDVRERGFVRCGVHTGIQGFAAKDSSGKWQGLNADFCRAVAAATLKDANKVEFAPVAVKEGIELLKEGKVDLLARNLTQTLMRDSDAGLSFAGINFYDGQGIMVRRSLGAASIRNLSNAAFCVQPGSTSERNLEDFMHSQKITYRKVTVANAQEMVKAYQDKRCDAMTTDYTQLAILRQTQLSDGSEHLLFRERLSKEPLGPLVRKGDEAWFKIVKWTLYAQIAAEEMGITKDNADEMRKSPQGNVRRFLGIEPGLGRALGLNDDWAYDVIRQTGNYGESFEHHLGGKSPIGLERGLNDLWTRGGLMYAPPFQ